MDKDKGPKNKHDRRDTKERDNGKIRKGSYPRSPTIKIHLII